MSVVPFVCRVGGRGRLLCGVRQAMTIFSTETEFVALLEKMEAMIDECASGKREFYSFHREIGYLHSFYALDGHESDEEELAIMERHRSRLSWIERVLEEIGEVCSAGDAPKEAYIRAGRFGSEEALRRMRELMKNWMDEETKNAAEPGATDNPDHRTLKSEKSSSIQRTQPGV